MKISILFLTCMGFIVLTNAMIGRFRNSPPPIITLSPDARILVKIQYADHIEAGHIRVFAGEAMHWLNGILVEPEEPDRVHVKLRRLNNFPERDRRYIASLQSLHDVGFISNQPSKCFVIDGEDVWHATLTPGDPSMNGPSSAMVQILARDPLQNYHYDIFGGLLIPWDTRQHLPIWVERSIAAFV